MSGALEATEPSMQPSLWGMRCRQRRELAFPRREASVAVVVHGDAAPVAELVAEVHRSGPEVERRKLRCHRQLGIEVVELDVVQRDLGPQRGVEALQRDDRW